MARLRIVDAADSDDSSNGLRRQMSPQKQKPPVRSSPRKKAAKSYRDVFADPSSGDERPQLQPKNMPKANSHGKQRRLAPLQTASLNKQSEMNSVLFPDAGAQPRRCNASLFTRKLPSPVKNVVPTPSVSDDSEPGGSFEVKVEVEESIWCGSDASSHAEEELPSPRKFLHFQSKKRSPPLPQKSSTFDDELDLAKRLQGFNLSDGKVAPQQPATSLKDPTDFAKDLERPGSSSDKENNDAFLRFSPPRLRSPSKDRPSRPVTPPQSPTKSRLQSPSKTKTRVPSPKLRQNLDAFWNAETVNDWNDQYSPRKVLRSPTKLRQRAEEENSSPTTSPRKPSSPTKRSKAEREAKQRFEDQKHSVAEAFLAELDEVITGGRVRALAASTGGVRFVWSKTLNSTAGRANWRRETTKVRNPDGTTAMHEKHHASIELAEKVINDEHRLLNVVAHEFCHLANFMVSGIKDQPHGAQFKVWGRKVTESFAGRGVEVTTKHTFEIEYKYVWRCEGEVGCGSEFRRHSKSIDPGRHTCGRCRGRLVQVRPVPRGNGGAGAGDGGVSGGYAAFVKLHFKEVKGGLSAGASQKAVMEALGVKYRAEKAKGKAQASDCADGLARSSGTPEAEADGSCGKDEDDMERLAGRVEVVTLEND